MQRDPRAAARQRFDVAVIGAGVYGACIARLLARAGASVCIIDRGDFGGEVSRNSLKIVHGGFRYIQHFDVPRIRESVAAQRAWMEAAPHLVRPMRCIVPAYGWATRGPLVYACGALAYRLAAGPRRAQVAAAMQLGPSKVLSRRALLARFPALERRDLSGGVSWFDAQILDAPRLIFECLQDAAAHGAVVLNHMEAVGVRIAAGKAHGVLARDRLDGQEVEIDATFTVNAAGPQVPTVLAATSAKLRLPRSTTWTRNVNFVCPVVFDTPDAVGVASARPSDAAIGKSNRLFFITRWQDRSIVGTSHFVHDGPADSIGAAGARDALELLGEVRDALPGSSLRPEDICSVHAGLTPAESGVERSKRGMLIEHDSDGAAALLSVLGIKLTTAPTVARQVAALVLEKVRGEKRAPDSFAFGPLPGAPASVDGTSAAEPWPGEAGWAARIYGTRWPEMRALVPAEPGLSEDDRVFRCRVLHGIRSEMVVRLGDALKRATDRLERGTLRRSDLDWCVDQLASHHGWSPARRTREVDELLAEMHGPTLRQLAPAAGEVSP